VPAQQGNSLAAGPVVVIPIPGVCIRVRDGSRQRRERPIRIVTQRHGIAVGVMVDIAQLLVWRGKQVACVLIRVAAHPRLEIVDVDAIHELPDVAIDVLDAPVNHRVFARRVAHQAARCGCDAAAESIEPSGVV